MHCRNLAIVGIIIADFTGVVVVNTITYQNLY